MYLSTISTGYASVVKKCTWFFICFSLTSNIQCISGQKLFFQSDRFISFCYSLSEMPSFNFPRPGCYCASQFPLSFLYLADQNKWKITSFTKLREQHDSSGWNFFYDIKICSLRCSTLAHSKQIQWWEATPFLWKQNHAEIMILFCSCLITASHNLLLWSIFLEHFVWS